MQRRGFIAGLSGLVFLPGCAALVPIADDDAAFFDARSGRPIGARELARRLAPAPIVLLGEVHDNLAHHRIRGRLLRDWVGREPSRAAVVVFEQLDREHNEALRLAQRRPPVGEAKDRGCSGSADGIPSRLERLLAAARFDHQGWGWPAHRPVFEAADASDAPWIAANLSRASAQQISRDPSAPVDVALQAVVESARWSEQAQASLAAALMAGHCNLLSATAVEKLARVQRLRDAALALPLLDAQERRSMLIAGNGHVRRDHGVPRYLGAYENEAVVVGFEEAAPAPNSWADDSLAGRLGAARAGELALAYDLVCLTTRERQDDPCAGLTAAPGGVLNPAAPTQTPLR